MAASQVSREYGFHTVVSLLAALARTTTQIVDLLNESASGIHVILNMTTVGTGSVTVSIDEILPDGTLVNLLTGAAITTNSKNIYKIFPAATPAANLVANDFVPRNVRITVTANNANPTTYTLDVSTNP